MDEPDAQHIHYSLALTTHPSNPPRQRIGLHHPATLLREPYHITPNPFTLSTAQSPAPTLPPFREDWRTQIAPSAMTSAAASGQATEERLSTHIPATSLRAPETRILKRCIACTSPEAETELTTFPDCGCNYCSECITTCVKIAIKTITDFPPRCCERPMTFDQIKANIPPGLFKQYVSKKQEYEDIGRVYCCTPNCSLYLRDESGSQCIRCKTCGVQTCRKCKQNEILHTNDAARPGIIICPIDKSLREIESMGRKAKWKHCPVCNLMIDKLNGCNAIQCVCGVVFCYNCGKLDPEDADDRDADDDDVCMCGGYDDDRDHDFCHHDVFRRLLRDEQNPEDPRYCFCGQSPLAKGVPIYECNDCGEIWCENCIEDGAQDEERLVHQERQIL